MSLNSKSSVGVDAPVREPELDEAPRVGRPAHGGTPFSAMPWSWSWSS